MVTTTAPPLEGFLPTEPPQDFTGSGTGGIFDVGRTTGDSLLLYISFPLLLDFLLKKPPLLGLLPA